MSGGGFQSGLGKQRTGGLRSARSHRKYRRLHDSINLGLNVVPLVDVTFLLMIFFVIAGTFEMSEGVLASRMLPVGAGGGAPLPVTPIVVQLDPNGDSVRIELEQPPARPATFRELSDHLAWLIGQPGYDATTPVVIMADDRVVWDHVVNAWNAAHKAGFQSIAFTAGK